MNFYFYGSIVFILLIICFLFAIIMILKKIKRFKNSEYEIILNLSHKYIRQYNEGEDIDNVIKYLISIDDNINYKLINSFERRI